MNQIIFLTADDGIEYQVSFQRSREIDKLKIYIKRMCVEELERLRFVEDNGKVDWDWELGNNPEKNIIRHQTPPEIRAGIEKCLTNKAFW